MTAPTLMTVSESGMNHSQPMSGRVNIRMSPARRPGDALVLRVDRDVEQERVVLVAAEALHQHTGSSRRIDHDPRPQRAVAAEPVREAERGAVVVEDRIDESMLFEYRGTALLGMAEQDLVESFPQHLERLGRGRLQARLKVGVLLGRPVRRPKA